MCPTVFNSMDDVANNNSYRMRPTIFSIQLNEWCGQQYLAQWMIWPTVFSTIDDVANNNSYRMWPTIIATVCGQQ